MVTRFELGGNYFSSLFIYHSWELSNPLPILHGFSSRCWGSSERKGPPSQLVRIEKPSCRFLFHSEFMVHAYWKPTWMSPNTTIPTHPNLNLPQFPQELGSHPKCLFPLTSHLMWDLEEGEGSTSGEMVPGRYADEHRVSLRIQEACSTDSLGWRLAEWTLGECLTLLLWSHLPGPVPRTKPLCQLETFGFSSHSQNTR